MMGPIQIVGRYWANPLRLPYLPRQTQIPGRDIEYIGDAEKRRMDAFVHLQRRSDAVISNTCRIGR